MAAKKSWTEILTRLLEQYLELVRFSKKKQTETFYLFISLEKMPTNLKNHMRMLKK